MNTISYGIIWGLLVVICGAYLTTHFLMLYPEVVGVLLPLALVLIISTIIGGQLLIRTVLSAIK